MGELTLDSSTSFVRADAPTMGRVVLKTKNKTQSSSSDKSSSADDQAVVIGSAAHSALPVDLDVLPFWTSYLDSDPFGEFLFPHLEAPKKRIERPPIA